MLVVNKPSAAKVWLAGGAVIVVVLIGVYYATRSNPPAAQQPAHVEAYAKMLDAEPAAATNFASAAASGVREVEQPADFDPIEWQQLVSAVRDHPKRDQELQRLVGYLRFQRDTDKWMALKDQPNALERAQVGQRILDALPARFANQEVTGAEALILQASIYAEMIPDEAQRKPMLEAAREGLTRALEQDGPMQAKLKAEDAATADYKEREAAVMRRFSDQLIDQKQMEKELDAARVAAFK